VVIVVYTFLEDNASFFFTNMNNNKENNNINIIPKVIYAYVDIDKSIIYEKNINKNGVYRWIYKINGKSCVGSYKKK